MNARANGRAWRHSRSSARRRCALRRAGTLPGALAVGVLAAVQLAAFPVLSPAPARAAARSPELVAAASVGELRYGQSLDVAGRVSAASGQPLQGAALALQAAPFPYRGFSTVARVASGPGGGFAFTGVRPDRNTQLRVLLEGSSATSAPVSVIVDPAVTTGYSSLGLGRTLLRVRLAHPPQLRARPVSASWYVAARGSRVFHLVAVTLAGERSRGVTYATATVDPPSSHFAFRVCVDPGWGAAMGGAGSRRRCPRAGFQSAPGAVHAPQFAGQARGIPLPPFPSANAVAAASRFLAERSGRGAFAIIDSSGRLEGAHLHERFETASVVKVMMLVAYLQMRAAQHLPLGAGDAALLYPMIHISDNNAASAVLSIVGQGALARVAREAGMSEYAPGVGWWALTLTSAADQARLMYALPRLIPSRFYAYARGLLAGIAPSQSWGVPAVARPRWSVYFKTGWLPEEGIFTEVARLERRAVTFSLAVLTSGEPSMAYGEQTIAGVAAALLAHAPN